MLLLLLRHINNLMKAKVFAKGIQIITWKSAFLRNRKKGWKRIFADYYLPFITTLTVFFLKCFFSCLHLLT